MTVDIIVPVYRDLSCARRCLASLLEHPQASPHGIVVVDDACPEPELATYLDELANDGHITLLRNSSNLGFVASVNRGIALHPDHDVVLLNSDTQVANDWLDRLLRALYSSPNIGTATPFSNNATICSYPYEDWHADLPGGLGLAALDALVATTNPAMIADLPTAVGFCMAIRRTCLAQVGMFDAERFPRGYGEENDFCRRAAQLGWRHVLAADVFVYHQGSVSFGGERHALMQAAWETISRLHPDYPGLVGDFIARDPLAHLRRRIDRARQRWSADEARHVASEQTRSPAAHRAKPAMLHILHGWGGGVARWTDDFRRQDVTHRHLLLYSRGDRNALGIGCALIDPETPEHPLARWTYTQVIRATDLTHAEYAALLDDIIAGFDVRVVVVSSLLGHGLDALATGLPTLRVLHDLYPYCPAMFGFHGRTCSSCDSDNLAACLSGNPLNECWHVSGSSDWLALRPAYAAALRRAEVRLLAPSQDAWRRLTQLLPDIADLECAIVAHGIDLARLCPAPIGSLDGMPRPLRVIVPGRLEPHKGLHLLRQIIPDMLGKVDFFLLGCGDFATTFADLPNVRAITNYDLADLARWVADYRPDCALLASLLPETFSYTLSEMSALAVPCLATRLGAFAERIDDGVDGLLVEPDAADIRAMLTRLAADTTPLAAIAGRLRNQVPRSTAEMVTDILRSLPEPVAPALRDQLTRGIAAAHKPWQAEITALTTRLAASQHEAEMLRHDLHAMRTSHSWRLLAPLRRLVTAWRLRNVAIPPVASAAPGLPPPPDIDLRARLEVADAARIVAIPAAQLTTESITRLLGAVTLCATHRALYFLYLDSPEAPTLPQAIWTEVFASAPRRVLRRAATPDLLAALNQADLVCMPAGASESTRTWAIQPNDDPKAIIAARLGYADGA
jgi:GT2 family glycosyltransferase